MTACPLCKGPLERLGISLKRDFVMCINEDCVYPFQDEQVLLSSVIDLRPAGHRSLDRKRKPEPLTSSQSSAESIQQSAAKKSRDADTIAKSISTTTTTTYTGVPAANASHPFHSASKSSDINKGGRSTNSHVATKTESTPVLRKETLKSVPSSVGAPTKEKTIPVGRSSTTSAAPTLSSIPAFALASAIPATTSTIALPATASASAIPATAATSKALSSIPGETSAIPATAAISRTVSSIPDETSAIPPTAVISRTASSIPEEISVSLSSSASSRAAFPTAISLSNSLSQPGSPTDLPDLTFELFPSESWITPVTPPDTYSPSADGPSKAVNPVAVTTSSTMSIESLLFDDSFDIDISGIADFETNGSNTVLQFDADFEALLQQQF